jgi:hypothetical protein
MRKCLGAWILVSLFCVLSAHAESAQPNMTSLEAGVTAMLSVPEPIFMSTCSATANCDFGTVSCGPVTVTGTSVCVGVDTDCSAMQVGYVQCGSQRVDCADLCPDPCRNHNRQYPGCGYTYSVEGQCCVPTHPSCPYFEFCG